MKIAKTAIISTLLFTFNAKAIDLNVNDVTQINMSGEVNQAITYNNWSCVCYGGTIV